MIRLKIIFALMIILILSCKQDKNSTITEDNQTEFAKGFNITETKDGYSIDVFNPWQGASDQVFNYSLCRKDKKNCIKIPVSKAICMSSTHAAYIHKLDKSNKIKGLSGTEFIYNPEIRKKIDSNKIVEIGFSGSINLEKIASINPDVIFAYVISGSELKQLKQLEKAGFNVVLVGDYLEATPLGKAEWLKFFSCFFDNNDYAEKLFHKIHEEYDSIKNRNNKYRSNPDILVNIPYEGIWWLPGGNSYLAKLISDAGGNYLFSDLKGSSSKAVDIEEVYKRSIKADILIHTANYDTKQEAFNSDRRLKEFTMADRVRIFNNNKIKNKYGNDFYESAVVNPHIVLSDLISIFHPEKRVDSLTYYKELK